MLFTTSRSPGTFATADKIAGSVFSLWYWNHMVITLRVEQDKGKQTFLIAAQSVMLSSLLRGEILPWTTASILFWTSERGCGPIRTTKSDVLASDTPYRLMASLICSVVSADPAIVQDPPTLFVGFRTQRTSEWIVFVRKESCDKID
jgi:hypothetical protein